MNIAQAQGLYAGEQIAVLGNGPSVRRVSWSGHVTIGVNRTPLILPTTWWLTLDAEFLPLRRNPSAVLRSIGPSTLPFDVGPIDDRGMIVPGMESSQYAETGTFPGQRLRKPPAPDRLFNGCSSVQTAIHLALIFGAAGIHLIGCDGAGPRFTGELGDQGQLREVTRWLEDFGGIWKDRLSLTSATEIKGWKQT